MNTRKIRIFTSKGAKETIETSATTWGDLKPQVEEHYDLSNLQPTESVNKATLVHKDAVLPEGDFVLFLRPVRTKSGVDYDSRSFTELRALLDNDTKAEFEDAYDKNWTRASHAELVEFFTDRDEEVDGNERERLVGRLTMAADVVTLAVAGNVGKELDSAGQAFNDAVANFISDTSCNESSKLSEEDKLLLEMEDGFDFEEDEY